MKRRGGFTLMEILITMTLISILMGLGIGMYSSMASLGKAAQARNTLVETIQAVKVSSYSWPADLIVDPVENRVFGREFRTVLSSNFEVDEGGDPDTLDVIGLGLKNGKILGGGALKPFPMGHTGGGLVGGEPFGVDFDNYADYDFIDGVSLEIAVYPTVNQDMYLIRKGRSYGLKLDSMSGSDGPVVVGYLSLGTAEEVKRGDTGNPTYFRVDDYPLVLNRWNRIVMNYNRTEVTIAIDSWDRGVVTRLPPTRETKYILPDRNERLLIGDGGGRGIIGRVDDLRIAGIFTGDIRPFPIEVSVSWLNPDEKDPNKREVLDRPLQVHFQNGKLDPTYHQKKVSIFLKYKGNASLIEIGLLGNILAK